jgi:hypothetical protein
MDGAFLLGLSALITAIAGAFVTVFTVIRKTGAVEVKVEKVREHVDGRFDAIQATVDRKIERGLMLEAKLTEAGIGFEPDRTDIVNGGT